MTKSRLKFFFRMLYLKTANYILFLDMGNNTLIQALPFSQRKEISTLIENRRAFTLGDMELNVFETYQPASLVPLRFDDLVFINMIQGKKVMYLNNINAFDYLPGQTIVLPAYTNMEIDFPEASMMVPSQCTALTVSQDKIKAVMSYLNEFYPLTNNQQGWNIIPDFFHLYNTPAIAAIVNKLFAYITSTNPMKDVLVDLTFKELFVSVIQSQSLLSLDLGKSINSVLVHLKDFIKRNITEKLTIETLQKVANMSKASLTRMFKRELGVSPMEYIIRLRLDKAKQLLSITKSVKESCFASGFNDVNYFVRLFKNREGVTPGNYLLMAH